MTRSISSGYPEEEFYDKMNKTKDLRLKREKNLKLAEILKGVKKMKRKDRKLLSQTLVGGALVSVILAAIGYLGVDIWLASTQWLLVAAVLALFGIYFRPEE